MSGLFGPTTRFVSSYVWVCELSFVELSAAELSFVELSVLELSSVELAFAELSFAELSLVELSLVELSVAELSDPALSEDSPDVVCPEAAEDPVLLLLEDSPVPELLPVLAFPEASVLTLLCSVFSED